MTSVFSPLFALPFLLFGSAVLAQETPPVGDCEGMLKSFGLPIQRQDDSVLEPIDGGCHARNVLILHSEFAAFRVEDLRVSGKDLFEAATAQRMPETLDLTVKGFRMSQLGLSPVSRYVTEVVQGGYDLHLAYQWNAESHDFVVEDLTVKDARLGMISLKGAAANLTELPATNKNPPENARQAALKNLSLRLDNHGLFEMLVVIPLISQMPNEEDPQPRIAQYQKAAAAFVDGLPETVADTGSKTALKEFIADFPHPAGTYEMDLVTKIPVSVEEAANASEPIALAALLAKLTVSARHEAPAAK